MAVWALKEKSERNYPAHTKVREDGREVRGALGAGAETKTICSKSYVSNQNEPKYVKH